MKYDYHDTGIVKDGLRKWSIYTSGPVAYVHVSDDATGAKLVRDMVIALNLREAELARA